MNADDAFGTLMRENKLAIPLANPAVYVAEPPQRPAPDQQQALRVDEVLDGEAEYNPGRPSGTSARWTNHPTETELEAVRVEDVDGGENDEEQLAEAVEGGARIVGLDADAEPAAVPPPARIHSAPAPAPTVVPGSTLLANAKRVRRFAQLPIEGNEVFDSAAMEMAVGLAAADPGRPSLLLTGPARGEGRTEMALRLALAVARRVGMRVLLADFDLKKPNIAIRLGLVLHYFSLAEVLRGTCSLDDALIASDEDNLFVLAARPSDRSGDEIVEGRQASAVLADIHAAFDFAVIDCGPIEQSEAQILCRHVGSVAVVGYGGLTTAGGLRWAARQAEAHGGRVAGMLLAGM